MAHSDTEPHARVDGGPKIADSGDAGTRNLGYPRTVQRPDCKVETMCYFNDAPENERYLAASIRDAGH